MDRQNSQASASKEDLGSLQQLEPLPVESPVEVDKQLPDVPLKQPARTSTLGLSGGGHSSVYYLTRLQRYSSYVFTIYTTFHITNTSLIPLLTRSVPASDTYLLLTRPYYQSPFLEPLLITLPILAHVLSGFALRVHRRNTTVKRYGGSETSILARLRERLHVWPFLSYTSISGYVLAPLVVGHALINRILPWWVEGGSSGVGLGFVSHGFAKHPIVANAGYAGLIVVASGHMVWGMAKWRHWTPGFAKKSRRRWWLINGVAAIVAGVWAAGALGVVGRGGEGEGWVAEGWDQLYAKIPFLEFVG